MERKEKETLAEFTCKTLNNISAEIVKIEDLNDDVEYAYKKTLFIREQVGVKRLYDTLRIVFDIPFEIKHDGGVGIKRFTYAECN